MSNIIRQYKLFKLEIPMDEYYVKLFEDLETELRSLLTIRLNNLEPNTIVYYISPNSPVLEYEKTDKTLNVRSCHFWGKFNLTARDTAFLVPAVFESLQFGKVQTFESSNFFDVRTDLKRLEMMGLV